MIPENSVRRLSRFQIAARLKERGVTQGQIAHQAGCSVGYVNQVIAGRSVRTTLTERVWAALERALAVQRDDRT